MFHRMREFCDDADGIVSQFMHAKSCHRRRRNHWQAPGAKNTLQEASSTPTPSPCERTMRPRDSTHCANTCQYTRREEIRDVLDHFSIDKENVWYVRRAGRLETGDRKRAHCSQILYVSLLSYRKLVYSLFCALLRRNSRFNKTAPRDTSQSTIRLRYLVFLIFLPAHSARSLVSLNQVAMR